MKKLLLLTLTIFIALNCFSQLTFNRISSCVSVLSMWSNSSKPLSYNRYINTVCFIQRKSPTYVTNPVLIPNAQSGAVVAYLGRNLGSIWDSTLLYADNQNYARHPQGGISNPMGNHTYTNAYVVGSGPTINVDWTGSWYASKPITAVGTNSAGSDMQYFSDYGPVYNTTTSPTMVKHDDPQHSFSTTDIGLVYSMGIIVNDPITNPNFASYGLRGGMMTKGSFNSGAFVWTCDSFIPATILRADGKKQLCTTPYLAWNDAGTIGYVVLLGTLNGKTGSNKGWQPIIYKTTNGGNTWVLVNGIDFNTGNWSFINNSLEHVNSNSTTAVPFFDDYEGIDLSVDNNGKLHIFSTVKATLSSHNDSLDYIRNYNIGSVTGYNWKYQPTKWPYLLDFIGDGAGAWTYKVIDSVGTQSPNTPSTSGPFPWMSVSGPNVPSGMRLQMSRSYDGEYMVYSWAESDTILNTNSNKFNEFPNIKTRAMRIFDQSISLNKISITNPATGFNPRVRDKAFFHYLSRLSPHLCPGSAVSFTLPVTVSNNLTTDPNIPVDVFYSSARVQYNFATTGSCVTNSNELPAANIQWEVFPNPALNYITVQIDIGHDDNLHLTLFNALGQKSKEIQAAGFAGKNSVEINLSGLRSGIYFVKLNTGGNESVKKLIKE